MAEVDISTAGARGDEDSSEPVAISAGGRYVAFTSYATNLDPLQPNLGYRYLYLRDRKTGTTRLISVSSEGQPGRTSPQRQYNAAVTPDGRYVVFTSSDHAIDPAKRTNWVDAYRHDTVTGRTVLVSESSTGTRANGGTYDVSVSADGRYVAFGSFADNLVFDRHNRLPAVFVRDLQTARTTMVNRSSDGQVIPGGALSTNQAISGDGSAVTYSAPNHNPARIHLHNMTTGRDSVISRDQSGRPAGSNQHPEMSANGQYVQFLSDTALAPGGITGTDLLYRRNIRTGDTVLASVPPPGKVLVCNGAMDATARYSTYNCYPQSGTYRYDLDTGQVTRVDVNGAGQPGNGESAPNGVTTTGHVVFQSRSTNIGAGGDLLHVYVR